MILNASLGVHNTTGVAQAHVASRKHVVSNRLSEDLDTKHISNNLLRLSLQIRVYERDVVVAANDISKRGQSLLNALDPDVVGDRVSEMLQFLIGGRGGDQQPLAVSGRQAADDSSAGNGGVADGYYVLQLGFEDGVEVFGGADGDEGVAVCESCENTNSEPRTAC